MGDMPYPTTRSGLDLRTNRGELLSNFQERKAAQRRPSENNRKASSTTEANVSSM